MRVLFVLFLSAFAPFLAAQTYSAAHIAFSDLGPFTQQQLEDASGLHTGSTLTAQDLSAAAQRLVNTGYFDAIDATLDGKISSATVKFDDKPTPLQHMLHVTFTDLVWLTPAEIDAAIKQKFPLFIGYLPENSPHQDDIKAALTSALAAKSISARVACDEFQPTLRYPTRQVACSVTNPTLTIANVRLGGVTPPLIPLIQKSVNATARTRYSETVPDAASDLTTADRILTPLLDAGYITATLSNLTLTPGPAAEGKVPLVLAATLIPGEIYHLSSITFAGTPFLSAESFTTSAKLHPGELAAHDALLKTLAPIDDAYRRKGYMDVTITAAPALDDTAHTVAYNVTVSPGEQYRVHEITADNLDPAAKADFDRTFLMKPGELYNPFYVSGFLQNNTAVKSFERYSAGFKAYADPNTHTVDLVITFARGAS